MGLGFNKRGIRDRVTCLDGLGERMRQWTGDETDPRLWVSSKGRGHEQISLSSRCGDRRNFRGSRGHLPANIVAEDEQKGRRPVRGPDNRARQQRQKVDHLDLVFAASKLLY